MSATSEAFSWLFVLLLAVVIGFVSLAWPEDGVYSDLDQALLILYPPEEPEEKKGRRKAAATEADEPTGGEDEPTGGGSGGGDSIDTDGTTGTGTGTGGETEGDSDGLPDNTELASPIPVEPVPNVPDVDAVLDDLPAIGGASKRKNRRLEVGEASVVAVADASQWLIHKVTPTESPDQIAFRYGVRPESLRMWNGIKAETTKLRPGTRIKVQPRKAPPARRKYDYWVQPGDTWWSIGTSFGVDSRDLRSANAAMPQKFVSGTAIEIWIDPVVYVWATEESDPQIPRGIRLGSVGIGPPQGGRLVNGVQLPPNEAYVLKLPPSSFGTTHAVGHVARAMDEFRKASAYRSPLMIGSMSGKHGGPLSGHKSHQTGRDLDIRLPLRERFQQHIPVTPVRVDWVALWHLVDAFDAAGDVVVIFLDYEMQERLYKAAKALEVSEARLSQMLQYPHGNKATLGLIRHSPGHLAHIHIRFSCGSHEPECVAESDLDDEGE